MNLTPVHLQEPFNEFMHSFASQTGATPLIGKYARGLLILIPTH